MGCPRRLGSIYWSVSFCNPPLLVKFDGKILLLLSNILKLTLEKDLTRHCCRCRCLPHRPCHGCRQCRWHCHGCHCLLLLPLTQYAPSYFGLLKMCLFCLEEVLGDWYNALHHMMKSPTLHELDTEPSSGSYSPVSEDEMLRFFDGGRKYLLSKHSFIFNLNYQKWRVTTWSKQIRFVVVMKQGTACEENQMEQTSWHEMKTNHGQATLFG